MRFVLTFSIAFALAGLAPLSTHAEDVEAGFHGADTRLDNYWYEDSSWMGPDYNYAVCGADTPFLRGVSVNEKGLWDNSGLCSSYPVSMAVLQSFVANLAPHPREFSPKIVSVSDCGADGLVVGVAQPADDKVNRGGTPVLCAHAPGALVDCRVVEMPGDATARASDASENGAQDWSEYAAVTCGQDRFARAVAYRQYDLRGLVNGTFSWGTGGLICCGLQ